MQKSEKSACFTCVDVILLLHYNASCGISEKGEYEMKKLLAIVLVVSLFLTGVGFVPVAYAAEEDGLIAEPWERIPRCSFRKLRAAGIRKTTL